MKKSKSEYSIQTVANALKLLSAFRDDAEIGVAELSRRLGLHKNNVFRLLATLEQGDFIEQNQATERYRLAVGALELGQSYARGRGLLGRLRPVLAALAMATGETVHAGVLSGHEVVHVDGATSPRLVRCSLRVGMRLPVHCTALGKALLGCSPESEWERFDRALAGGVLEGRSPHTITDRDKFFDELRSVAGQGFALDCDECEVGLVCAAAPVYDAAGDVAAALSTSAPAFRAPRSALLRDVVPRVNEAAARLSRELGYLA
jgi:IclR family transcriptional regulator, KDG regulon repressor